MKSLITLIARAAAAAGVDDMSKGYPKDQKQRGATFWAAFTGHVNGEAAQVDEYVRELEGKIHELETECRKLTRKLEKVTESRFELAGEKLVNSVRDHITEDQRKQYLADMRS